MIERADFVVIGAGSAGCVLANRLSADPNVDVAVLEAGPMDKDPLIHIPIGIGKMHKERRHDWGYNSEPQPHANNRVIEAMRGKVLGGSSSINVMAYVRGHRGDFDRWAQKGATGWGYDDVLPYFRRNETWEGAPDPAYRGDAGALGVIPSPFNDPLFDAWVEAGKDAGYAFTPDYNGAEQEGFGRAQFTIKGGRRCSAAVAFLKPALSRPNLELMTEAHATRILFEGTKAVGVEYLQGGVTRTIHAHREVVLSGGVFNSPHLLMLSGVGPAAHLREHGIDVLHDLPGVGANLQDHLAVMISYRRKSPGPFRDRMRFDRMAMSMLQAHFFGKGYATVLPGGLLGHVKSRPELAVPDIQFIFRGLPGYAHLWFPVLKPAYEDGFGIRPILLHPESRGRLELRSADPRENVKVFQNFFSASDDLAKLREGVRMARRATVQAPLDPYRGDEIDPGIHIESDDAIDDWIRETMVTAHHPACTCAMGVGPMSVLNPDMTVKGIESLRVVDAAAMPDLTSGNINAPVLMMAEKASDMMLGKASAV